MNTNEAATLVGAKPEEVISVEDSPAGPVIVTRDGVAMVLVDEANPDAEGKHGLMYLAAPSENYTGLFPVYAAPDEETATPGRRKRRTSTPVGGDSTKAKGADVTAQLESSAVGAPDADGRIIPDNGDDPAAGPSAATAAHPDKVAAGEADTRPDPSVDTSDLDPGIHDPAVGGPAGEPQAMPPVAGDGPVGTAVIAEVPAGSRAQVLDWVGTDVGRAKQALAAERAATKPRATLVASLTALAENGAGA